MRVKNILLLLAMGLLAHTYGQQSANYKIVQVYHLPGDKGWDYLASDDETGRLFISHGDMVQVMDESTGKVLNTITGLKGVHGIALAVNLGKGYISNGRDSSVTVFSLSDFKVLDKIIVTGKNPDAILYDAFAQQVFTFNGKSANCTVIDAKTDKVKSTIKVGGAPEFAVSDGKGKIFLNLGDKSQIQVINTTTLKVENTWPVAPGKEPSGLALDNTRHRLFSACDNKTMVIIDANDGKVIGTSPIGEGTDAAAFDAGKEYAFSSNGDGTMTVVKVQGDNKFEVVATVKTQKGAKTMAINQKTHHLFLSAGELLPAAENAIRVGVKPNSFVVLDIAPE